ncbi:MAG: sensor histidine kinase [Bacteroidota bacterium]
MKNVNIGDLKEIQVRWIGIPIVGVIISIVVRDETLPLWQGALHSMLFTGILWNGAANIFFFYRRKFPSISQTPRRLIFTLLTLYPFILIADPIICVIINEKTIADLSDPSAWTEFTGVSIFTSTLIGILYEAVYFFNKWKESFKLTEELRNQQIRTQFEVLQNQMSPHFLFNSLNTLTTLIAENQELAIRFTEKLSETYRYILQNKERELVKLSDEMEFAKNYVFLLKMRFPENLLVNFKVDRSFLSAHIAPLTLQMLIENAIKHNMVIKAHPLNIDIYVENGNSIVVKNNLQVKNSLEKSTKTGLANISKRYELLGNRKIDIITTAKNFMVAVPLINVINERKLAAG